MGRRSDANKDQELINLLKANARRPLSDIADKLGVSRATVQARLARLERDNVIAGYTIVPGSAAEASKMITAIMLVELEIRRQVSVTSALKKRQEVVSCYTMNGQFDLFVRIECRTAADLDLIIDWIAELDGVRRTHSSILLARKIGR